MISELCLVGYFIYSTFLNVVSRSTLKTRRRQHGSGGIRLVPIQSPIVTILLAFLGRLHRSGMRCKPICWDQWVPARNIAGYPLAIVKHNQALIDEIFLIQVLSLTRTCDGRFQIIVRPQVCGGKIVDRAALSRNINILQQDGTTLW